MTAPGLNKPWSIRSKKRAEEVAKEVGGIACPLREAIKIVANHPANQMDQTALRDIRKTL